MANEPDSFSETSLQPGSARESLKRLSASLGLSSHMHAESPHPIHIACLIGATGLVGRALLEQLLADPQYAAVRVFTRRSTGKSSPKLQEHLIDFDDSGAWEHLVTGDVLFSTLGTTRSAAGSFEAQRKVDYGYQLAFATAARKNLIKTYILVSSAGADSNSMLPYAKMKGELESDVIALSFPVTHILRPGPLEGEREHPRTGERILLGVMRLVNSVGLLKRYAPVTGPQMGSVMRSLAKLSLGGQGHHPAIVEVQDAKIHEPEDIARRLAELCKDEAN